MLSAGLALPPITLILLFSWSPVHLFPPDSSLVCSLELFSCPFYTSAIAANAATTKVVAAAIPATTSPLLLAQSALLMIKHHLAETFSGD